MLDYDKLMNWPFEDMHQSYEKKDVMLYALGIGFGFNPTDPDELKFVFEKELQTFPTMAVILGHPYPDWPATVDSWEGSNQPIAARTSPDCTWPAVRPILVPACRWCSCLVGLPPTVLIRTPRQRQRPIGAVPSQPCKSELRREGGRTWNISRKWEVW